MAKNLYASIALTLALLGLGVLVIWQIEQTHHLEEIVLDAKKQTRSLSDDVRRLNNLIESGDFQAGTCSSGETHPQRRYFSETEWTALNAPGNLVALRTEPMPA